MRSSRNSQSHSDNLPKGEIKHLRRIFSYLSPYKKSIFFAGLSLIITSSSVLGMGQGLRFLVDEGIGKSNIELLSNAYMILLGVVVMLAAATYGRYFLVTWIGERVVADIRGDVYRHLINLDATFFETNRIGELLSRLGSDTTLLQTVIGSSVSVALRNIIMLSGGIVMLMITSMRLSGYIAFMIPIIIIPIIIIGKRVRALSRETQDCVADMSSHAEETLSSVQTVQALTLEQYEAKIYQKNIATTLVAALKRIKLRSMLTAIVIMLIFGAVASVLWVGGRDVINGSITAGELSSFLFYAMIVAASTGALSEVVGNLQRAAGATERLMELKATIPSISPPENHKILPDRVSNIKFDNVTFYYPSRQDVAATKNLSLDISAGEHIALVGASGAGKSTLFHLLGRIYDPSEGGVSIEGIDLRELAPQDLRSHIGLVPQDPVIFSSSAFDNIKIGRPTASRDEVIEAAKQAEALEFMEELPNGIDSFLGEKGVRLSGGQRQRVAIARAIVRNPDILLLDEATSALDSENERKVQTALESLMKNRTTLVIAHRLATVRNADRIIVMNQGQIEAIGTHNYLMANNPLYIKLAGNQFDG